MSIYTVGTVNEDSSSYPLKHSISFDNDLGIGNDAHNFKRAHDRSLYSLPVNKLATPSRFPVPLKFVSSHEGCTYRSYNGFE